MGRGVFDYVVKSRREYIQGFCLASKGRARQVTGHKYLDRKQDVIGIPLNSMKIPGIHQKGIGGMVVSELRIRK